MAATATGGDSLREFDSGGGREWEEKGEKRVREEENERKKRSETKMMKRVSGQSRDCGWKSGRVIKRRSEKEMSHMH